MQMDKKSKILLIIFIVLLIGSVSYTFYKTVIRQDFSVVNTESSTDASAYESGDVESGTDNNLSE